MGECRTLEYKTNEVVTHGPLVCFGGFGQPRCKFLLDCMKENNMTRKKVYRELLKEKEKKNVKSN